MDGFITRDYLAEDDGMPGNDVGRMGPGTVVTPGA